MGNLTVSNSGNTLAFVPLVLPPIAPDARLNSTGSVVDFGTIQTDGIVSLLLDNSGWSLRVYPNFRNVTVRLNAATFPVPQSVTCDSGPSAVQHPATSNGYWSLQTIGSNVCKWAGN